MSVITLAIATGRMAARTIDFLEESGIYFPDYHNDSRKLVMYDTTNTVKLIFAKTADLGTYVDKGAADIGIVGKDIIVEEQPDVYELLNFDFSNCRVVVAGFPNTDLYPGRTLTVATKYPRIAGNFFHSKEQAVEIIPLNGSIELAPLMGLSDVIVDIVETGATLEQNGLVVLEDVLDVSARLIVNKASYATKTEQIEQLISMLKRK